MLVSRRFGGELSRKLFYRPVENSTVFVSAENCCRPYLLGYCLFRDGVDESNFERLRAQKESARRKF